MKEPSEMLVHVLSQVDSFTAPLALWLGIRAAPAVVCVSRWSFLWFVLPYLKYMNSNLYHFVLHHSSYSDVFKEYRLNPMQSHHYSLKSKLKIFRFPLQTFHRSVDNYKPLYHEKLALLPWWITCHRLTASKITDTIENAYFLVWIVSVFFIKYIEDFTRRY